MRFLMLALAVGLVFGAGPAVKRPPVDRVQTIIDRLSLKESFFRVKAAEELGKMGAAAHKALPVLENLAKSEEDEKVRQAAAAAVEQIRQDIPRQIELMKTMIAAKGEDAKSYLSKLDDLAQNCKEEKLRNAAAEAAVKIRAAMKKESPSTPPDVPESEENDTYQGKPAKY